MSYFADLKEQRTRLLYRLFEHRKTSPYAPYAEIGPLAADLGIGNDDLGVIMRYLNDEGYIETDTTMEIAKITHLGVQAIERAELGELDTYAPITNIIHADSIVGASIQQGSPGAKQNVTVDHATLDALLGLLPKLREAISEVELEEDDRSEAEADLTVLQAQAESSRPKRSLMIESLKSLRTILEGAAGNVLASEAAARIAHFISMLAQTGI